MDEQWTIAKYNPEWESMFRTVALPIRTVLNKQALRIDHVGSTAVAGLDAKPIVDIQISVPDLEGEGTYIPALERLGFVWRRENPDKTKHYFRERPGDRRTHIHVRRAGSFSEQMTLLFRDYLREHPAACLTYAEEKHRLMKLYKQDRPRYVEGKGPIVWEIMRDAHTWSQEIGWSPGASDI